jgi:hypothetical protein
MAACLWYACIEFKFVPREREIAAMMQLQHLGIARGKNSLRKMAAADQTSIEVNRDTCAESVNTLFLNVKNDSLNHLLPAVEAIVRCAIKHKVGTSSLLYSKVVAAGFIVFRRHALLKNTPCISVKKLCDVCHIRKNTIETFINTVESYGSLFEPVLASYNLGDPATGTPVSAASASASSSSRAPANNSTASAVVNSAKMPVVEQPSPDAGRASTDAEDQLLAALLDLE